MVFITVVEVSEIVQQNQTALSVILKWAAERGSRYIIYKNNFMKKYSIQLCHATLLNGELVVWRLEATVLELI